MRVFKFIAATALVAAAITGCGSTPNSARL
jgi:hypothetical protein